MTQLIKSLISLIQTQQKSFYKVIMKASSFQCHLKHSFLALEDFQEHFSTK